MNWLFHWETEQKVSGYFDQNSDGKWLICINKSPVPPELLAGRKVSIKGQPRRLGQYLHSIGTVAYFAPWPDKASEDYCPAGLVAKLLDRFRQSPDPRREFRIRQELKTAGAVARARLGVTDWNVKIFERYALEPLDNLILQLSARGLYATPINELHESKIDGLKLLNDLSKSLANIGRGGERPKNF